MKRRFAEERQQRFAVHLEGKSRPLAAASAAVYALYIAQRMDMVRISIPVTGSILDVDGQMRANVLAFLESLHPTPVRLRNVEGNQLWMLKQAARNVTVDCTASNIGAKFSARGIKALLAVTVVLFDVLEAFVAEQVDIFQRVQRRRAAKPRLWRALRRAARAARGHGRRDRRSHGGGRPGADCAARVAVQVVRGRHREAQHDPGVALCVVRDGVRVRGLRLPRVQAECAHSGGPGCPTELSPNEVRVLKSIFFSAAEVGPAQCAWQTVYRACPGLSTRARRCRRRSGRCHRCRRCRRCRQCRSCRSGRSCRSCRSRR